MSEAQADPMTVGDLRTALDGIDSGAWVCINGNGPATRVMRELGANEPFVLIVSSESASR
jgi:hypothetical protein